MHSRQPSFFRFFLIRGRRRLSAVAPDEFANSIIQVFLIRGRRRLSSVAPGQADQQWALHLVLIGIFSVNPFHIKLYSKKLYE